MNRSLTIALLCVSVWGISCSNEPEMLETVVKGTITVSDSLDNTGDYSGINIRIFHQASENVMPDTILDATTNISGEFESRVEFPRQQTYRLEISRNGTLLERIGAILAADDTLTIEGQLPDLEKTLTLKSFEHDAMDTYYRLERSFQRVSAFVQAGAVPDSLLADELDKWSDLYWQVFEKYPKTVASYMAAEKSAELLNGWNYDKMNERIDEALPADYIIPAAFRLMQPYLAETKGFDAADNYIDSLAQLTKNEDLQEFLLQAKIKMHFDSSRIDEAKLLLLDYEKEFTDNENSLEWFKQARYDLNYLAPGVQAPEFEFLSLEGDTINNQSMLGNVYIMEISALANREYQNSLDRTMVIYQIYKNYGLNMVTVPLDNDSITVDAFYSERSRLWPVAKIGTFDVQKIMKKFNVTQIPTRILVDENGMVIRKYVRGEFEDVIEGLNQAFQNNKPS